MNCFASLPNASACESVNFFHSAILSHVLPIYSATQALLAATSNSVSRTTEAGSSVFINWNIPATSHGHVLSFNDATSDIHWLYASSNALTCGSDLNDVITWFACVNCLSVRGLFSCVVFKLLSSL
jgi:hypothetical protein